MKQARASTLIASPPQAVFEFVAVDFVRNYRRWSPEVERLELFTPGPMKVGSRARQVRMDHGRRSEHTFRVVAFEPPRRISFAEIADRFRIDYQMEPEGDQTRLTFLFELRRMELYMRPFEKLIRVALQEGAERVVGNIKRLIETESRNNTRAQH